MRLTSTKRGAAVAAASLLCGACFAAGPALGAPDRVIHACANRRTGALRLAGRCNKRTERALQWSVNGAVGAAGPAGPQGPVGPQGSPGPDTGSAAGALSGSYPSPSLNVSGGDSGAGACRNGEALTGLSPLAALTCGLGIYSDQNFNFGVGPDAFGAITDGKDNTGFGPGVFGAVTSGFGNSALGGYTLSAVTSGQYNTAIGAAALHSTTIGMGNIGIGSYALLDNTAGQNNVAIGGTALYNSVNADNDVAVGAGVLSLAGGGDNTAVGTNAGASLLGGAGNVLVGEEAGSAYTGAESDNIDIGAVGQAGDSGVVRIGGAPIGTRALYIPAAEANIGSQAALEINPSTGQIGVATSSERFKTDIRPLGAQALGGLMSLRPVTFRYRRRYLRGQADPLQYGLIAEDVAKVYPSLVVRGPGGRPYTVAYQELPTLLLAEVQRQHRQIVQLESALRRLDTLQAEVRALVASGSAAREQRR